MFRFEVESYLVSVCVLAVSVAGQGTAVVAQQNPASPRELGTVEVVASAEDARFFESEVRPLLSEHCLKCHGAEKQEGNLRLDKREYLVAGGDSGAALDVAEPQASLLLSAVHYQDFEMPPAGQLADEKVRALEEWIARGAPWPATADEGGIELRQRAALSDVDRNYWAFRPLESPALPQLNTERLASQALTPVDLWVLAKLDEQQLTLAPPADPRTLLRRLYLDLVGVPPTPLEIESYLADSRADAYEHRVNELLDDPRYGEKWALHWLDLVRYAESDGFNQDAERPTAFLYRDWLIDALNADIPYDEFVLAQLAGDEVAPNNPQMLAATGYLRHWIYEYNQRDARTQWSNILNDITDVTGEVFFGLGLGCARCHDHKFDPLLQKDYFRLQASFAAFIPRDDAVFGNDSELAEYQQQLEEWKAATADVREQLRVLEEPIRRSTAETAYNMFPLDVRPILFKAPEDRDGFEQQIAELADRQVKLEWDKLDYAKRLSDDQKKEWERLKAALETFAHLRPKALPNIMAAGEIRGTPPSIKLPTHNVEAESVLPAAFEVLGAELLLGSNESVDRLAAASASSPAPLAAQSTRPPGDGETVRATSGRRTALAHWINSPENGLTHRVIVNRMWQELFGTGIVRNANDFGRLGDPPTHPQLLDWLASWFIQDGRSFKRLHRLLVTSAVYRQSSQPQDEVARRGRAADWENRLLWHFPARRLEAEQIRDSMLVAAGSLQHKAGGKSAPHDSYARSIYTQVKRNKPHPMLVAFDVPDRSTSVGQRNATTTVNQSLVLSNSEWPLKLADEMAGRLLEQSSSPEEHVRVAFERALGRRAEAADVRSVVDFLRQGTETLIAKQQTEPLVEANEGTDEPQQWARHAHYRTSLADFCHVLFNSSEFLYID